MDLIAAVLADALEDDSYDQIVEKLEASSSQGTEELKKELESKDSGSRSYWICAFCVNQHVSICDYVPANSLTDTAPSDAHTPCPCKEEKYKNGDPRCEMDKFDDMMRLLKEEEASIGSFGQVIAVDRKFELFTRAWCVAEIAEAAKSRIPQFLKLASSESVDTNFDKIDELDVRKCKASRQEDKDHILWKIERSTTVELFNEELCRLIGGIAFRWMRKEMIDLRAENQELRKGV
jgi:hypothetical protein